MKNSLLLLLLVTIVLVSAQESMVGRRVPSFIGTRGKKSQISPKSDVPFLEVEDTSDDDGEPQLFSLSKRARIGFQGTRGKKSDDAQYKRAMGFMGTRGKKMAYENPLDLDEYWLLRDEFAKRKFYGMRGKKMPISVMGARGKKGPSANAFFGMRGKKSDIPREDLGAAENLAAMIYLLTTDRDYQKHHAGEDIDFEISDSDSSSIQEQPLNIGDNQ